MRFLIRSVSLQSQALDGRDTYVLCEINVSSVAPYPDSAAPKVAEAALDGVCTAIGRRC